jgi:hypothetical protein
MYRLHDPRDELFAQEIARGASAAVAYARSGYTLRGKRGAAHARKLENSKPVMVRVAELSRPDSNRDAADCGDMATMLSKLEDARLLAMAKMQPAPAVYAVVAMARIKGLLARDEPVTASDRIFADDVEAARRVAFLLKLGGIEPQEDPEDAKLGADQPAGNSQ